MQIERITDVHWEAIEAAVKHMNGTPDYRSEVEYGEPIDFTRDTIEDFDRGRRNWRERGHRVDMREHAPYVIYERVQAMKGQPRTNVVVIDCGDFRVVIEG